MEELQPVVVDRLALSLVNHRQVQGIGFRKTEGGGVAMDDATRKEVLTRAASTICRCILRTRMRRTWRARGRREWTPAATS
jgi:CRISPR/Cas system-associated endonuclease Cas1